jgi:Kef-type K+ transport system membrane component KefB
MLNEFELSLRFFLQLAFILGVCRVVGWLARCILQPQVLGEMIGGILLGPSLLGWLWPEGQAWLFPKQSMAILFSVSQLGLVLYMFLCGVEFHQEWLRDRLRSAAMVSVAGMLAPFILGGCVGFWLHGEPGFFGPKTRVWNGAFFLGAALSITAFPVLSRMIRERGLTGTPLGTLTLAAGALDDVTAWCILALVLASFDHHWQSAALAIGGGFVYALLIFTVGRKFFSFLGALAERKGKINHDLFALTLVLVMLGSWFTDAIKIYAVFGAFVMGLAMPRGLFAAELKRLIEPLTMVFLLPLFFTFSGLNTRIDLVRTPELWVIAAIIFAVACLGKGGACYAAARLRGEENRSALAIGTLMNVRGLMELIMLNIGLQYGIIHQTLFTIMVMMAIGTSLMAAPLFEWVYGRQARIKGELGVIPVD